MRNATKRAGAAALVLVLAHGTPGQAGGRKPEDALSQARERLAAGDAAGARGLLETLVGREPGRREAWLDLGRLAHQTGDFARAAEAYERALELRRDWQAMYNAACAYARLGQAERAWAWLEAAADTGSLGVALLEGDADLAGLRTQPRFARLRERAARASEPCRFQPESNQFDFWLGEWSVRPRAGGSVVGHSRIEKILSNCVVLENWTGANGWSGKSFNIYEAATRRWRQTWVDQSGAITDFVDGQAEAGVMSFRTRPAESNGVRSETRLTFTALDADHVRQHAQRSTDGGQTWQDQYDFIYERAR